MLKYLVLCLVAIAPLHALGYVKAGGGVVAFGDVGPAVAFGTRYTIGGYGVELSSQLMAGAKRGIGHAHVWSAPRVLLLGSVGHFFFGAGPSFGGARMGSDRFLGIMGEAILGFHPMPKAFLELGIIQPVKPVWQSGLSRPSVSLSLGVGF
jgi:hypothetical protein